MQNHYSELAKSLAPNLKKTTTLLSKIKSKSEATFALNLTRNTLKIAQEHMSKCRKKTLKEASGESFECIYFESAFVNINLALEFLATRTITPNNLSKLLEQVKNAHEHLEKCANNV